MGALDLILVQRVTRNVAFFATVTPDLGGEAVVSKIDAAVFSCPQGSLQSPTAPRA